MAYLFGSTTGRFRVARKTSGRLENPTGQKFWPISTGRLEWEVVDTKSGALGAFLEQVRAISDDSEC